MAVEKNLRMNARRVRYALVVVLCFATITTAHEGPPYPLFVDQKVDRYVVSLWSDPDVGTALFFMIISAPEATQLPSDLRVQIGVQPVSGRLPETFYLATRENVQGRVQYRTDVHFDTQEFWRVRVRLESGQGSAETITTVEATPPGYGRWDLLLYVLPFVAVGLLWAMAMVRKARRSR